MNPPGSPAVGSNGSGRVCPPGPIMSPTVDEIATGKNGDSRPDRISAGHRPGAAPVRSDAAMLRSLGWILSRLPSTHMSVVASTRAVGWESVHGVITAGRLEDFFDYSVPFHCVAFNLRGATTVEWKHGLRFTRFHAQPGELLVTPSGGGQFHPANPAKQDVQLLSQPGTFAVPRRARVANAREDG